MFDYGGGRKTFCCLNGKITQIAETHWSMSVTMRVAYHNMKRNRFDWVNCRRSKCNIWFSTDFGWAMYLFKLWYEMSPHIWEFTYHARLKTKKGRTVNFKLATRTMDHIVTKMSVLQWILFLVLVESFVLWVYTLGSMLLVTLKRKCSHLDLSCYSEMSAATNYLGCQRYVVTRTTGEVITIT